MADPLFNGIESGLPRKPERALLDAVIDRAAARYSAVNGMDADRARLVLWALVAHLSTSDPTTVVRNMVVNRMFVDLDEPPAVVVAKEATAWEALTAAQKRRAITWATIIARRFDGQHAH